MHIHYFAAHDIPSALCEQNAVALPMKGCGTVSSFHGKGKKSAWETLSRFPVLTPVFAALSRPVPEVAADMIAVIWSLFTRERSCVF